MKTRTRTRTAIALSARARRVAGCLWDEEVKGSLAARCRQAAAWRNLGTDGDLSEEDRDVLLGLAEEAEEAGL